MIILSNVFVFLLLADPSLYLLRNHSLHTGIITEMDFLHARVRLERERGEKEGEVKRKPFHHLFIHQKSVYFSLETQPLSGKEHRLLLLPGFYLPSVQYVSFCSSFRDFSAL